jgi:hypothetical protein
MDGVWRRKAEDEMERGHLMDGEMEWEDWLEWGDIIRKNLGMSSAGNGICYARWTRC